MNMAIRVSLSRNLPIISKYFCCSVRTIYDVYKPPVVDTTSVEESASPVQLTESRLSTGKKNQSSMFSFNINTCILVYNV